MCAFCVTQRAGCLCHLSYRARFLSYSGLGLFGEGMLSVLPGPLWFLFLQILLPVPGVGVGVGAGAGSGRFICALLPRPYPRAEIVLEASGDRRPALIPGCWGEKRLRGSGALPCVPLTSKCRAVTRVGPAD